MPLPLRAGAQRTAHEKKYNNTSDDNEFARRLTMHCRGTFVRVWAVFLLPLATGASLVPYSPISLHVDEAMTTSSSLVARWSAPLLEGGRLASYEVQSRRSGAEEWETAAEAADGLARPTRVVHEVQVVQTRADAGETIAGGGFRLSFQYGGMHDFDPETRSITDAISHNASEAEMRGALEALSMVDAVEVKRVGPDAQGGYTWTLTLPGPVGTAAAMVRKLGSGTEAAALGDLPSLNVASETISFSATWSQGGGPVVVKQKRRGGKLKGAAVCEGEGCVHTLGGLKPSHEYLIRVRARARGIGEPGPWATLREAALTAPLEVPYSPVAPSLGSATTHTINAHFRAPAARAHGAVEGSVSGFEVQVRQGGEGAPFRAVAPPLAVSVRYDARSLREEELAAAEHASHQDGGFSPGAAAPFGPSSRITVTLSLSGLEPATVYALRVRAASAIGASAWSAASAPMRTGFTHDLPAPGTPWVAGGAAVGTAVAMDGGAVLEAEDSDRCDLYWAPVPESAAEGEGGASHGSRAARYEVQLRNVHGDYRHDGFGWRPARVSLLEPPSSPGVVAWAPELVTGGGSPLPEGTVNVLIGARSEVQAVATRADPGKGPRPLSGAFTIGSGFIVGAAGGAGGEISTRWIAHDASAADFRAALEELLVRAAGRAGGPPLPGLRAVTRTEFTDPATGGHTWTVQFDPAWSARTADGAVPLMGITAETLSTHASWTLSLIHI